VEDRVVLRYRIHSGNLSGNALSMRRAALRVANRALVEVCARHLTVARNLLYHYLDDTYSGHLHSAAAHAWKNGQWNQLLVFKAEELQQRSQWLRAKMAQKLFVMVRYRRFRLSHQEWLTLGRRCTACGSGRVIAGAPRE
jgi:hypothetical protein